MNTGRCIRAGEGKSSGCRLPEGLVKKSREYLHLSSPLIRVFFFFFWFFWGGF